jgi:hypothetical protein
MPKYRVTAVVVNLTSNLFATHFEETEDGGRITLPIETTLPAIGDQYVVFWAVTTLQHQPVASGKSLFIYDHSCPGELVYAPNKNYLYLGVLPD